MIITKNHGDFEVSDRLVLGSNTVSNAFLDTFTSKCVSDAQIGDGRKRGEDTHSHSQKIRGCVKNNARGVSKKYTKKYRVLQ